MTRGTCRPLLSVLVVFLWTVKCNGLSMTAQNISAEKQLTNAAKYIISGDSVRDGKTYPFYVQIATPEKDVNKIDMCGGAILGRRSVITAAHCVATITERPNYPWQDAHRIRVFSGDITESPYDEPYSHVHYVDSYYAPWQFQNVGEGYDIVILNLDRDIEFDEYRQPITPCAPSLSAINSSTYHLKAIGLGLVNSRTSKRAKRLMEVILTEIQEEICRSVFWSYNPPPNSQVCHNNVHNHNDTCFGDSGGPLFLVHKNDASKALCLYGITSYGARGKQCGDPNYPTVAVRASHYMPMFTQTNSDRYRIITSNPEYEYRSFCIKLSCCLFVSTISLFIPSF